MSAIKNVTIVGAAGNLGKAIFQSFVTSKQFNIQVLRRSGSSTKYPEGTQVIDADFSSVDSLTQALKGQDAVVSVLGDASLHAQTNLIDASVKAGVQRFLPSEFGCDLSNANNKILFPYVPKVKFEEHLAELAKTSSLTYTFVYNGALLDWGIRHNFLLDTSSYEPKIFNDGERLFNTTSLETVGDAVRGVLASPEKTKNRAVYVSDMRITQNQLLDMAKKAAPEKSWQPKYISLDETVAAADKRLAQGIFDMGTIVPYLCKGIFHPDHGNDYEKNDNEILGVVPKTKEFVEKVFVEHLSQQ